MHMPRIFFGGYARWCVFLAGFLATLGANLSGAATGAESLPNVVVIFIDDMGYADIGPFGATAYQTPHLDRMAREGMRFTDFVVSSAVCSSSRCALLTGCYHARLSIHGALGPDAKIGIHADELTLGELCQQRGYATACIGKWHLGHHRQFLPLQNGFDEYFGLPYSNDMWPLHPDYIDLPSEVAQRKKGYPDLPLFDGNEIVDPRVDGDDQRQLTTRYTERAVDFIRRHRDRPFLLYLPHSMVHVPLFTSDKYDGKSGAGRFGDAVQEVDWSVGQILETLRTLQLEKRTLVIFTSDNGPWLSYGDHAGSARPLREGKGTSFEGGIRVPTIMWWPDRIAPGTTCDELAATIDVVPTVAKLIGAELPQHPIDGQDIRPLMFGQPGAKSPHTSYWVYYAGGELQAIRDREWKLYFPHEYRSMEGQPRAAGGRPQGYKGVKIGLALYNLKQDISETRDVASQFPDVVARLQMQAEQARESLGDRLQNRTGNQVRAHGVLPPG